MRRRTVLKSFAALAVRPAMSGVSIQAADQQPGQLSAADIATLHAIADVVLPASIGADARDRAINRFVTWIRNYKEGADRGYGYGASTLSAPAGPSPALRYPPQFAALDQAAKDRGAASFAALGIDARRAIIETALNTPQPVTRMPARPTGANLVADFMGYYFNSADALDVCYEAAIRRDACRGLAGSENAPRRI